MSTITDELPADGGKPVDLTTIELAQLGRVVDRLQQLVHRGIVALGVELSGQGRGHPRIFSER